MTLALEPGPMGIRVNDSTKQTGKQLGADAFVNMPVFDAPLLIAEIQKLLPNVPWLETDRLKNLDERNT